LGVAREKEVTMVKEKRLLVERKDKASEPFKGKIIKDIDFEKEIKPDIIFLTTKNPITEPIKYYYQKLKKGLPTLLISQNGIAAIKDAKKALKEVFGQDGEKVRIVRIVLFNPVDKKEKGAKVCIKYSLPIRIALTKAAGEGGIEDIVDIFKRAGFEISQLSQKEARNLEFSKLFLNLIGMAAASRGISVREGFENKEIFIEEIEALREYILSVKKSGGQFLNFPHYPVRLLTFLFSQLPISILLLLRGIIAKMISKGRGGKPKDLDEIDYYNGAVVDLGKEIGVETKVNNRIYQRSLKKIS
jgi:ketopantoate reductase